MGFDTLLEETKLLIKCWEQHYKHIHPNSSLEYSSPAPEAFILLDTKTILYAN